MKDVLGPAEAASGTLAKAGTLWTGFGFATLGVTNWSEAAQMAATISGFCAAGYSLLLCLSWCFRMWRKWKAWRKGELPPPITGIDTDRAPL